MPEQIINIINKNQRDESNEVVKINKDYQNDLMNYLWSNTYFKNKGWNIDNHKEEKKQQNNRMTKN